MNEFDVPAIRTLDNKKLVKAAFVEGGGFDDVKLTANGREYLYYNPKLRNPVNWGKISAIAAISGTVITLITMLVACRVAMKI